ncbi:contractile injection system protein, VgrG/Pvc8 family [Paenibacillus hexagrammi]|uniref:Phage late control D family protein n=1 Tax=Paenibacillus hexagrammi TaxID=2908839 RepID=A0ABY3SDY8_9BACL|nr:contractile injection system protein, VgrG/Pvc8 family [Paenibacillus sp. YPD9-1]UJF32208.1 phage late control D family protein [Paenibacillus sp. YPD9-1]
MEAVEKAMGYGNIRIISPYELQTIQHMDIIRHPGEHARLTLSGIIPEEHGTSYMEHSSSRDTVEIQIVEENGSARRLFKGIVSLLKIKAVQGIYYLELECSSYTAIMDLKRKSRSFPNPHMTYGELIETVMSDYEQSDVLDYATGSSALGSFTLQYMETDWQFLKRMASHFGSVLMADAAGDGPKLMVGLPDGRMRSLPEEPFMVKRSLAEWMNIAFNDGHGSEGEFTAYSIVTDQSYQIGDKVMFREGELTVVGYTAALTDGLLSYTYMLSPLEAGMSVLRILNHEMTGATLLGSVQEVKGHSVKVKLDIDEGRKGAASGWFPYASAYSAEGSGGGSTICQGPAIGYSSMCRGVRKEGP